ncbi:MAG: NTP-binding protein [Porticoccaceae bacterium]|jgi:ABC-type transporter Mla MlaB component|nr:NTP-binding protein [Porticoccaceae bacterium]
MTKRPERAPRTIALRGDLTAREVPGRYAESLAWRRANALPVAVDLAGVGRTDSSVLALLLEWQAWAHASGTAIEFHNPPAALKTFASLSAASPLLGWPEDTPASQG